MLVVQSSQAVAVHQSTVAKFIVYFLDTFNFLYKIPMALSTDQPKITKEQDRFQRYEFAKRIANMVTVNDSENSLVVGLYGKWGEGKTSVMNFIKQELPKECIVVNFNPWLFNDEERLIKAFFNDVAAALKQSIHKPKENIGKVLSEYGNLIGSVKVAGLGFSGLSTLGDKWKDVTVEQLKARVDAIITTSGKRIVVFVDDIDRLDVREIQNIFKLIKLVGDFSNTTYILAFDDEMVATALAPVYGNGESHTGYQFLEKIIQVPLIIPKATKAALVKYTMELLGDIIKKAKIELATRDIENFRNVFDENFVPAINNPRLAIRYANSLFFSLPLLYGEVSVVDLMLVEALKVFYPPAYDFMRMNSPLFLTDNMRERGVFRLENPDKSTINTEVGKLLEKFGQKEKNRIMAVWQNLFPQYQYITSNRVYREDSWRDWYRTKSICSGKYFERYFTYVVIQGDLSDVFFDQFLKELNHLTIAEAKEKLDTLLEQTELPDVIFKLRLWEDSLNNTQSETLLGLLATIGSELAIEPDEFASYTSRAEGAKIIAQLICNFDKSERAEQAIKAFGYTDVLEFALEMCYWLFYKEEKLIFKDLPAQDVKKIHHYFVDRFRNALNDDNFFTLLSDANLWRVFSWWKEEDNESFQAQITKTINSAEQAISIIKVFAATITSWGGSQGPQTYKGGFTESKYDAMTDIIEPELIYRILNETEKYHLNKVNLQMIDNNGRMKDEELANVFIQFYEKKHLRLSDIND